jgi:hypothetical protein
MSPGNAVVNMTATEPMIIITKSAREAALSLSLADTDFAVACNTYNERTVAHHALQRQATNAQRQGS